MSGVRSGSLSGRETGAGTADAGAGVVGDLRVGRRCPVASSSCPARRRCGGRIRSPRPPRARTARSTATPARREPVRPEPARARSTAIRCRGGRRDRDDRRRGPGDERRRRVGAATSVDPVPPLVRRRNGDDRGAPASGLRRPCRGRALAVGRPGAARSPTPPGLGTHHPGGAPPRGVADLETARRRARAAAVARDDGGRPAADRVRAAGRRRRAASVRGSVGREQVAARTGRPASDRRLHQVRRRSAAVLRRPVADVRPAAPAVASGRSSRPDVRRRGEQDDRQPTRITRGSCRSLLAHPGEHGRAPPRRVARPETGGTGCPGERIGPPWPAVGDRSTRSGRPPPVATGVFVLVSTRMSRPAVDRAM